ncbi:MAG: pilus assembly protein [Acidobacteria bacterium]|nr:pilus assembly protein [Acidobacteriota bacterium]MCI0724687.1 pilus assembly protein [Acidobacteriota bacterium]
MDGNHSPLAPLHNKKSERGAELIEFALMLPILLVILAGLWDFGRAYRAYQAITNAAREGARLAVVPAGINQEDAVQNRVKEYLNKSSLDTSFMTSGNIDSYIQVKTPLNDAANTAVTVNLPGGGTAMVTVSRVSVNYPFTFFIFGPVIKLWVPMSTLGGSITLRTSVTMENQA